MAIFNSYVKLPEGKYIFLWWFLNMPRDHVWKIRWSSGDGLQRVAVEEDFFGFDGLDQIDDLLGKGWKTPRDWKMLPSVPFNQALEI